MVILIPHWEQENTHNGNIVSQREQENTHDGIVREGINPHIYI